MKTDIQLEPRWPETRVIYVRVPDELHRKVRRLAKRLNLRTAELVRQILTQVADAWEED